MVSGAGTGHGHITTYEKSSKGGQRFIRPADHCYRHLFEGEQGPRPKSRPWVGWSENQTLLKTKHNTSKTLRVETRFLPDETSILYHPNRQSLLHIYLRMTEKSRMTQTWSSKGYLSRSVSASFTRLRNKNITFNGGSRSAGGVHILREEKTI